jgi:hypothetical protein
MAVNMNKMLGHFSNLAWLRGTNEYRPSDLELMDKIIST